MKLAIVVGTRPEVIKMAPVIREAQLQNIDFILIHSNQHYSDNMDAIFFKELGLPSPDYNLNVGSGGHSNQTGNILIKIEPILEKERPDVLLAQGDTNTVMAAALAAHKLGIKVAHIEAGLRSYDRTMPEESNRVITDHVSDFLFAVTANQSRILASEGIGPDKIFVVGNTVVDAVLQNKDLARAKSQILATLGLSSGKYVLFTAHRSSNVDNEAALREIITLLNEIPGTVCWPIHLRTKKKLEEYKIDLPVNIVVTDPVGYLDFLQLMQNASLIVTDSGGCLQEEACILKIPCITIRENTERPETIDVGANILVGRDVGQFKKALNHTFTSWENPFGNGDSAFKICDILKKHFSDQRHEKITVVGMGYMGLPTALLFAHSNYQVEGFDIDSSKVEKLNSGVSYFEEEGIPELLELALAKKTFKATTTISNSDVYIVAVPTPHINGKCDLSYVLKACESIANVAKDYAVVIIESTIKPNTCVDHVLPLFKKRNLNIHVVHCPERAIPGETLKELRSNDRIIGVMNPLIGEKVKNLYSSFVTGKIFVTDVSTAEAVKLMENTFRDVNIALANEFSILADELGFNVWEAISLANRHPRVNILSPGPGVGGHCIAIDPWFLTEDTKSAKVIYSSRNVNDGMPSIIVQRLSKKIALRKGLKVGILGVAYKKNVDDARETPAEHIYNILKESGCEVSAHDPYVKKWDHQLETDLEKFLNWGDAFILVTDHDTYKGLVVDKPLVDTRNLLNLL